MLAENLREDVVCIQLHKQFCENKHFSWQKVLIGKTKMQVVAFFNVCISLTLVVLVSFSLWMCCWSYALSIIIYYICSPSLTKVCINDDLCARKLNTYKEILEQVVYIFFSFLWCAGAVLLSSVQGLAINVDPVLYTWLTYQPQKRVSRHVQQVCGFFCRKMNGEGGSFHFYMYQ